ncbi:MAG: class I SAM-dependent methyltransferase [Pseudomonadota bacterium]
MSKAEAKSAAPGLRSVPETMLWTLYSRATAAQRYPEHYPDPRAIEIYESIDYDYRGSFGLPSSFAALRARAFDLALEQFLETADKPVIVNLGEGLETQRFRVRAPGAVWLSVDLPESIEVRERYIQADGSHKHIAMSALDHRWLEQVPVGRPVFVSAQGLLMYLQPEDVRGLLRTVAASFRDWTIVFDTVPHWLSRMSVAVGGIPLTLGYRVPPMPWGVNGLTAKSLLRSWLGSAITVKRLEYPALPGSAGRIASIWGPRLPGVRFWIPSLLRVAPGSGRGSRGNS